MARRFPSLNALRTFEAAARHLSFSAASEELNVTQAAVSRQIRALEDDLGVKLFKRMTRAVDLTEEGTLLFPPMRDALDQIERATNRIWGNKGSGILTVSVLPTFSVKWLMPRLLDFSEKHPDIEVHLVNSIKPVDFEKEEIDLAIRVGTVEADLHTEGRPRIDLVMAKAWAHLQVEALLPDELIAVASPAYVARHGALTDQDKVRDVALLNMATRPNAWNDFFNAIGWQVDMRKHDAAYGHFFMTIQAAIEGRGIALVPQVLAQGDISAGLLVPAMPQRVTSNGRYCLIGRSRSWEQGKIKIFKEWLIQEAEASRADLVALNS
ncbi:transcriptional regulator GcvA [Ruegeria sp.]|uniref:transcriptional regulator GcvA n=1 Tax=Ruegeria sp. TaxID=1879320 RepID=UPI0023138C08|nr:transcriptional regulator GcvA [Ruegeria sp.]MDA7966031.1 transcriptional regulator GcvA [Ruegeria sp.]